jgi:hypothetical protein
MPTWTDLILILSITDTASALVFFTFLTLNLTLIVYTHSSEVDSNGLFNRFLRHNHALSVLMPSVQNNHMLQGTVINIHTVASETASTRAQINLRLLGCLADEK